MTIRRGAPNDRAFVIDLGRRVAPLSVASLRTAPAQSIERAYEHLVDLVFHRYSGLHPDKSCLRRIVKAVRCLLSPNARRASPHAA